MARGRGAIVLVPEIALTPQALGRFRSRFGERVAVLHSALTDAERRDERERIASGRAPIVVGARSAIFAPVPALGLICVDEEHDSSYKQESDPRYDARTVAAKRAALEGAGPSTAAPRRGRRAGRGWSGSSSADGSRGRFLRSGSWTCGGRRATRSRLRSSRSSEGSLTGAGRRSSSSTAAESRPRSTAARAG